MLYIDNVIFLLRLKYAGTLECDPKCEMLQHEISTEMKHTMPSRLAPTITSNLSGII